MSLKEFKDSAMEFKKELEREMLIRKYQAMLEGKLSFEQRLESWFFKAKTFLVRYWRSIVKRLLDLSLSAVAIFLAFPLMFVIAIVIKLSSKGPVFYRQMRTGRYGKTFEILKFRSMSVDAEKTTGPVWARQNDPRITPIGRFLRKTHLDELPQFLNVLKGEMSIVGPRPERPYFVSELKAAIPQYEKRLIAKPGITGLAQLKRHYDESIKDVKNKVRYDVLYVRKMCPLLDVKLIVMTFGAVVLRTGR